MGKCVFENKVLLGHPIGQTQVLDGFQQFHGKYSKTDRKQQKNLNLVTKFQKLYSLLDKTVKSIQNLGLAKIGQNRDKNGDFKVPIKSVRKVIWI